MKPLAFIAAMALALMAAGCVHEQPPIGGATAGTGACPGADWLTPERADLRPDTRIGAGR
jgi:hypothetical protein